MNKIYLYLILILATTRCSSDHDSVEPDHEFVPTTVIVKTREYVTIDKVFEFINGFDHDVEYITHSNYNSNLPPDSLQYVLNYINAKPYTHSRDSWYATGYLHYETNRIAIFSKLFQINNREYQEDWFHTMNELKLVEVKPGYVIYFHVPEGSEKEWETKFEEYDFVEWVQLNYLIEVNPYH